MDSNDNYIRGRAEIAGLTLSSEDVAAIRARWECDSLCNLDDLLASIRRLREVPQEPVITTPAF